MHLAFLFFKLHPVKHILEAPRYCEFIEFYQKTVLLFKKSNTEKTKYCGSELIVPLGPAQLVCLLQ